MKIHKHILQLESKTPIEFLNITEKVQEAIEASGIREGQVLVFAPHTTMSIGINHHESMLIQDFTRVMYKLVPVDDRYSHDLFELKRESSSDGRSNGHSHCKSLLMGSSETVPISKGKMLLGERQSIFAIEFDGSRKREVIVQVIGL